MKRLTDTGPGLRKYFSRLVPIGDRSGPILWQLPPNFGKTDENVRRLERFLTKLPARYRHAVEFRHPSWMNEQTFGLLKAHRACNVWISSLHMPRDYTLTSDFAYLRFHGLKDGAYHDYTEDELRPWAKQLAAAAAQGVPCYVYFNNDLNTRAPQNGEALMTMLGQHAIAPFGSEAPPPLDLRAPQKGPETWPRWHRSTSPRRAPPATTNRRATTKPQRTKARRPATASTG
jgi:uncharacterized protein YecE (DUF72 family)